GVVHELDAAGVLPLRDLFGGHGQAGSSSHLRIEQRRELRQVPRLEVADPGHGGIGRPGEERQREEPEEAGKRPHAPGEERSRGGTVNARPPRVTRDASPRRFASPQTDGATWTSEPTAATRGRKSPTRRLVGRGFGERRALRMSGAR